MPLLDNRNATDFFLFREEDPAKAADLVVEIVAERIPRKFGLRPDEIQVLSPMHRAEVGVAALNTRLQEALNPSKPGLAERQMGGRSYRTGDRVMQIRNDYDKEVYNGDMGRILAVNLEDQMISVKMDERTVAYDFLEMDELVACLCGQRAQGAGQRVSGRGHPAADHPLHDAATQPALHRGHPRPEAVGAGWLAAGHQHRRGQQPGEGAVFGPRGTAARDIARGVNAFNPGSLEDAGTTTPGRGLRALPGLPRPARAVVCQGRCRLRLSVTR